MSPDRLEEEQLLGRLRADAESISAPFGLVCRSIHKTRRDAQLLGSCDTDGAIRLRLRSRLNGEFLKYSSLVATLCHELAHLRHFSHGPAFRRFYLELLDVARRQGRYCPAPPRRARTPAADRTHRPAVVAAARRRAARRSDHRADPRQLSLFSPGEFPGFRPDDPRGPGPASPRGG
jgi:hypothetical protein